MSALALEPAPMSERGPSKVARDLVCALSGLRALNLAVFPGEEDGATLAWLRFPGRAATHVCFASRGENGQNEAGPEQGAELAVRRSKEAEAAARELGCHVWYLNLPDFGPSTSAEETLAKWGRERAVERLVRILRTSRPHVVLTQPSTQLPGTGPGYMAALAAILPEAMDAAADATKYPAQIKDEGLKPWTVERWYVGMPSKDGAELTHDVNKSPQVDEVPPAKIADRARGCHATQGPGGLQPNERHFLTERGWNEQRKKWPMGTPVDFTTDELELFPFLIPPKLQEIGSLTPGADAVLRSKYSREIIKFRDSFTKEAKMEGIEQRFFDAKPFLDASVNEFLGLRLTAVADDPITTHGETVNVTVRFANTGPESVTVTAVRVRGESELWEGSTKEESREVKSGEVAEFAGTILAKPGAWPSYPPAEYIFSRKGPVQLVTAVVKLKYEKSEWEITAPVPLDLALPRTVRIHPQPVLLFDDPAHDEAFDLFAKFRLSVVNHRRLKEPLLYGVSTRVAAENAPDIAEALTLQREEEGASKELKFWAKVEQLNKGDVDLPTAVWTEDAAIQGPTAKLRRVPLKLPPILNVALVKTHDDSTWNALRQVENGGLGMTLKLLTPDDLLGTDLNAYHAIVLDARAARFRPDVCRYWQRLMQFMKDGGAVVCLQHLENDWNPADPDAAPAPLPIALGSAAVTQEDAPVRITQPGHLLLSQPNRIWERDFAGWVVERAASLPKSWAPAYTTVLSMNDPNQPAQEGALLVTDVGQGAFVYCGLSLQRQWRAGNPGAYRLLANMISHARVKRNTNP